MSEIKYGLISRVDAAVLEKTMDLIVQEFDGIISTTEIGVYNGLTSDGLMKYMVFKKGRQIRHTGIDNMKDGEQPIHFPNGLAQLIIGNSNEVYNQLEDNSQHLIFVDGCHCFAHVISDFFCYAPKVKVGGYFCFHDTGRHIKPMKDFQHGDPNNPDAYISVRKALRAMGILDTTYTALEADGTFLEQWELVFDEADPNDEAGGVAVFRKLY